MAGRRNQGDGTGPLYGALWIGSIMVFGALAFATAMIGAASIPIWGIALGGAAVISRGPIGKAVARRISGDDGGAIPPELPGEILGELDDLRTRVLELEERVDFSERLLAQGTQRDGAEQPGA